MFEQWEMWPDCTFCNSLRRLASGHQSAFFDDYQILDGYESLIQESHGFILIPDIAPLSDDHLLLVTKFHLPSFAAVPEDCRPEAETLLHNTLVRMAQLHPDSEIIVFEHGVGLINGCVVHCGTCNRTDHAHLHLLPIPKTRPQGVVKIVADRILREFPLTSKLATNLPELCWSDQVGTLPYLMLWTSLDSKQTYLLVQESADIEIPSQVIRRLLGEVSLGMRAADSDLWDWRNLIDLYPKEMECKIRHTIQRWRAAVGQDGF